MADRLTIEHYVGEAFVKCGQVILGSRIPPAQQARPARDKRASRWFLLELDELDGAAKDVELWRKDISSPMVLEVSFSLPPPLGSPGGLGLGSGATTRRSSSGYGSTPSTPPIQSPVHPSGPASGRSGGGGGSSSGGGGGGGGASSYQRPPMSQLGPSQGQQPPYFRSGSSGNSGLGGAPLAAASSPSGPPPRPPGRSGGGAAAAPAAASAAAGPASAFAAAAAAAAASQQQQQQQHRPDGAAGAAADSEDGGGGAGGAGGGAQGGGGCEGGGGAEAGAAGGGEGGGDGGGEDGGGGRGSGSGAGLGQDRTYSAPVTIPWQWFPEAPNCLCFVSPVRYTLNFAMVPLGYYGGGAGPWNSLGGPPAGAAPRAVSGRDISSLATIRRPSWSSRSGSLDPSLASLGAAGIAQARERDVAVGAFVCLMAEAAPLAVAADHPSALELPGRRALEELGQLGERIRAALAGRTG
ncbi:hypothetical protein TSOC_008059 [Tetrabaena socialis]|uniref:Autophagy-related protein 13 N-terminal domain-containing protein n=1 Tax=Tetrabaena socialis TaxID=47790 RepID=A0A2J7ZZF3_9CHLO|nr:hypothetical protein TSOC_008059 [Tetrabaena socialis]|eukprot:PNH05654.1 hypothetical protein TSOC_008059 [Tetrabaena socialis]